MSHPAVATSEAAGAKRGFSLTFRILVSSALILAVVFGASFWSFASGFSEEAEHAMVEHAAAFTAVADAARANTQRMHDEDMFAKDEMIAEVKEVLAARRSYRESRLYQTIPVVAGWTAAREAAQREGIDFRVTSLEARNEEHDPLKDPISGRFRHQLISDLTAQMEAGGPGHMVRVDNVTNRLHYMRGIRLERSCLMCHGDPKTSPTNDGKDIVGFRMEGWKEGKIHGAYEVVMPLDKRDAKLTALAYHDLMATAPVVLVAIGLLWLLLRSQLSRPLGGLGVRLRDIAVGDGDLTQRIESNRSDEIGTVANWFNRFVGRIQETLLQVRHSTKEIDDGADAIAGNSEQLATGASQQAAAIEEITASLQEITGATTRNSEHATHAAAFAERAAEAASNGGREIERMNEAMQAIQESSREVAKIVKVIDDVAFQTNLLALNAAVEAARAGDAGKGFAVVAEEVRNLAQRSAQAARMTSEMIGQSTARAETGGKIAVSVSEVFTTIRSETGKVNDLLKDIADSTGLQATNVAQITNGVGELSKVTQQNAANSEELASTAKQSSDRVRELSQLVATFKL
jgi:methyl-accepting chemotaxis protein